MNPGQMLAQFLMASYLYYIRFQSPMSDAEFDKLTRDLKECWDDFEHRHKYLVTREDLNAGTLFALSEEDYPLIVKGAADMWLRELNEDKQAGDLLI